MSMADPQSYLAEIVALLKQHWPENRTVNIVCHGHSVPAGYFATPQVNTLDAYPHLLRVGLSQRFPFAVSNVIVTAVGGEDSGSGAQRFAAEVLCHRPDLVTIDYGLNDRRLGLEQAKSAWETMLEAALDRGVKVILFTPTLDTTQAPIYAQEDKAVLAAHAAQIRHLAATYEVGLVDSFAAFHDYMAQGDISDLLSWSNHPNREGHQLVARELLRWFPSG